MPVVLLRKAVGQPAARTHLRDTLLVPPRVRLRIAPATLGPLPSQVDRPSEGSTLVVQIDPLGAKGGQLKAERLS